MDETVKTPKVESENKKRVRSSTSGRYTNKDAAIASPGDTVSETPKRRADIKSAVEDYIEMKYEETGVLIPVEIIKSVLSEFALFYSKRKSK